MSTWDARFRTPSCSARFAAFTGVVSLDSVLLAIRRRFDGQIGERNASGATAAHDYVRSKTEASIHA